MRMRSLVACIVALGVAGCGDASKPATYVATIDVSGLIRRLDPDAPGDGDADEAAERLAGLGDDVVPALETALAQESKPVRLGIVEVLQGIESDRADQVLARIAGNDPEPEVRATALLRLGATGKPSARRVLEAGLDDPSPTVNQTAAVACNALCTSPDAIERMLDIALGTLPEAELGRMRGSLGALLAGSDRAAADRARERIIARTKELLGRATDLDVRTRAAIFAMQAGVPDMEPILTAAVERSTNTMLRTEALQMLQRASGRPSAPERRP